MNKTLSLRAGIATVITALALAARGASGAVGSHETTIRLELTGAPAAHALAAIATAAGREIRVYWSDDTDGLSREALVTLPDRPMGLATMLERVLSQMDSGAGGGATWQVASDGAIELGPRSRLNEHPVVRTYDVHDLLRDIPDYDDAVTIDLNAALQAKPSGSVLREPGEGRRAQRRERELRESDLIDLITSTTEPEQWQQSGGPATLRFFRDQLVVRAAPYIQRQLIGQDGL